MAVEIVPFKSAIESMLLIGICERLWCLYFFHIFFLHAMGRMPLSSYSEQQPDFFHHGRARVEFAICLSMIIGVRK